MDEWDKLTNFITYVDIEHLKDDERDLEKRMKKIKGKDKGQKIKYYRLALHFYNERERLVGLTIGQKITFKLFKTLVNKFEKKVEKEMKKQGVK